MHVIHQSGYLPTRFCCLLLLFVFGLPLTVTMHKVPAKGPVDTAAGKLATANTAFAYDLYKQLGKSDENRNLFFSPGSISVAMAMAYLGARENTASEMREVLKFADLPDDVVHSSFSELLDCYKKIETVTLHMANRLYADSSFEILESYLADCKQHYKADLAQVNFIKEYEAARQLINKWVEEQTADKIKDILSPGSVNSDTRAVLVNAVYFKGDWARKFKTESTKTEIFTAVNGDKVKIPMMYQKAKFFCGLNKNLKAQALELPYVGETMSMIIILPEAGQFGQFEKDFTTEDIINCEKSFRMAKCDVKVWLPCFKMEDSFSLGEHLAALGIRDLFDQARANLSGLDKNNSVFVSKVLHKSFLEVNEEGTEAAAATAAVMMLRMAVPQVEFKADRPFMFFIRENTSRSILFMGRLLKPEAESKKDEL